MQLEDKQIHIIFNKIMINAIDTNSGVFVGTNAAYGWNTSRKDNHGFGSSLNCTLSDIINVVYDNDMIDFTNEDQQVYLHNQTSPSQQQIHFKSIDVNGMQANSSVSVGESNQVGWNTNEKNNAGSGRQNGVNLVQRNVNMVVDNDYIDTIVRERHK